MTLVASAVALVPLNTAAAVETTWAGASDMLREAVEETRLQVGVPRRQNLHSITTNEIIGKFT